MESTIVIKVKYEDTLRRFNARVTSEGLALNMDGLRGKIFSLFKFAPDVALKLTYVDEDGDEVALVEDEDLDDVVKQSLNPLRIMVSLNTVESCKLSAKSSGSSTPLRSPRVQHPLQNLNSNVNEILKSLPQPLRESLSKLSSDLASKATSTAPNVAEIVDSFSKLGLSYLNQLSEFQAGSLSRNQDEAPKDPEGPNVIGAPVEVSQNARSGEPSSKINKVISVQLSSKSDEVSPKTVNSSVENAASGAPGLDAALVAPSGSAVANVNHSTGNSQHATDSNPEVIDSMGRWRDIKKQNLYDLGSSLRYWSAPPVVGGPSKIHRDAATSSPWGPDVPLDLDLNSGIKSKSPVASGSSGVHGDVATAGVINWGPDDPQDIDLNGDTRSKSPVSSVPGEVHRDSASSSGFINWARDQAIDLNGGMKNKLSVGVENSGVPPFLPSYINECPFSGMPFRNGSGIPQNASREVPYKRSYSHGDAIFHRGVRCDGCGVHPITGPRFKSKVKENYDLCSICFAEIGKDAEYMRIDRPVTYHHPLSFKGLYDHHARVRPPTIPPVFRGFGVKHHRPKLDSRFIQDVNILDGTIMAPSTTFTKIWRMRNNGSVAWPVGSQLVWIGGDKLTDILSVGLETTAGLRVDQEIDVAVDFVAPELPGRYISYWRMAAPTGQKFGQRVWVLIQVDASMKESVPEMVHGFNLNWPLASDSVAPPLAENSNLEPSVEDVIPEPNSSNVLAETVEPVVYAHVKKEHEENFPINDSLLVGGGAFNSSPSKPSSSSVSYPIIDLTEDEDTPIAPTSGEEENNDMEETLLKELKDMGFSEVNLNKKVLRKNDYDLLQSVDDLCGITEWDPILEELEEMGFHDKETNKKLLKKNKGSIKRVVMDLIAGETI